MFIISVLAFVTILCLIPFCFQDREGQKIVEALSKASEGITLYE